MKRINHRYSTSNLEQDVTSPADTFPKAFEEFPLNLLLRAGSQRPSELLQSAKAATGDAATDTVADATSAAAICVASPDESAVTVAGCSAAVAADAFCCHWGRVYTYA